MKILAWDQTLVEVQKVEIQPVQKHNIVELRAGDACLRVTESHRVWMQRGDEQLVSLALHLKRGDIVMCSKGLDLRSGRALDGCNLLVEEVKVVQVQFYPDKPVAAVHMPASAVLSLGQRWRKTRRGGMRKRAEARERARQQDLSIPDTAWSMLCG